MPNNSIEAAPLNQKNYTEITFITATTLPAPVTSNKLLSNFRSFAFYADVAYYQFEKINKWSCGGSCDANPGTRVVGTFESHLDTQAYIAVNDLRKLIILSFRGTQPQHLKDLWTDAQLFFTKYRSIPKAKIHQGFFKAFDSVAENILNKVKALLNTYPSYSVGVTGHSLGGALAVISSLHLKENIPSLIPDRNFFVYTYGQPRIGNDALAQYIQSQIEVKRVTHTTDITPHMPPRNVGYQHAPGEYWIEDDIGFDASSAVFCDGMENSVWINLKT
ncbi:hypothetical protein G9A89_021110 [Geosiphon pyriformis]|nr:hypothetical protein G9A89_021110 [Geosiphon pyriformis]